jgi:hypothetical protein
MARTIPDLDTLAVQMFRQMLAAELADRHMTEELKRLGYFFSVVQGCWVHPDGSEVWEDA